jgi:signal transduction histidine kinase
MKERLHQVERSQLNFAAAASHELRTPLHQINAAATLLRSVLEHTLHSPIQTHPALNPQSSKNPPLQVEPNSAAKDHASFSSEDKIDAISQLEIIEANGLALGQILENIIDTLDIGRMTNRAELQVEREAAKNIRNSTRPDPSLSPGDEAANITTRAEPVGIDLAKMTDTGHEEKRSRSAADLPQIMEKVVNDCVEMEAKSRRVAGKSPMEDVEVILEVLPRHRGGWLMSDDPGPLARYVVHHVPIPLARMRELIRLYLQGTW